MEDYYFNCLCLYQKSNQTVGNNKPVKCINPCKNIYYILLVITFLLKHFFFYNFSLHKTKSNFDRKYLYYKIQILHTYIRLL